MSTETIDLHWMKKPALLPTQQKILYTFTTTEMQIDEAIDHVKEQVAPILSNILKKDITKRNGMVTSFSPSQAKANTLYMMHATAHQDKNLLLFSAQIVSEAGREVRIYQEKWHLPC